MMNTTSNNALVDDVFDESLHFSYKSQAKDTTSSHGSSGDSHDSTLHNSTLEVCAEEDEGHEDVPVKINGTTENGPLSKRSSSVGTFKNTLQNGRSHSEMLVAQIEADQTYG